MFQPYLQKIAKPIGDILQFHLLDVIGGKVYQPISDRIIMTLDEALELIGWAFGNLEETLYHGLPDGADAERDEYDEELVFDIAKAVAAWNKRKDENRNQN